MTPSLPIQLPAIPDPAQSFEAWRTVERTLAAIAAKEEANQNLYRSEKIAYNAIAYARYQAHKRQWQSLWEYLIERQILQVCKIAAAKKMPSRRNNLGQKKKSGKPSPERDLFKLALPLLLTDKWQTIPAIVIKFHYLYPDIPKGQLYDRWLLACSRQGLCFKYNELGNKDKTAFYANCAALEFDDCWLPRSQAYKIAVQNGYTRNDEHFGDQGYIYKTLESRIEFYARYGLDYREEIPNGELSICRWKIKKSQ